MSKPRVIIPISLQFSVRYLLRTGLLERMTQFCEPVIVLAWSDAALEKELAQVGEVHSMIRSQWGARYERVRGVINEWHKRQFRSPSAAIRERRANLERSLRDRLHRRAQLWGRNLISMWPGAMSSIRREELRLLWNDTNVREIQRQIEALRADAVFCLTPFIPDEEALVRGASLASMPTCTAILSFDNL